MERFDLIVVGGGVSGASLAFRAASSGRSVLVLEREEGPGGCVHSVRRPSEFWFELGAHTAYNSYGAFIETLESACLLPHLIRREKPILRFLDQDRVLPGKNLLALIRQCNKRELLASMPALFRKPGADSTVGRHFGEKVGPQNYQRVLRPMLAALPSQDPDDLPASMLFKKRPRRSDVLRSFTLEGGLLTVIEELLRESGITLHSNSTVARATPGGAGFEVALEDGRTFSSRLLALAVPASESARILDRHFPELSGLLRSIQEARVESVGLAVQKDLVQLPPATFFIPLNDEFRSIVTRDVIPHPRLRSFTFHFKPEVPAERRWERALRFLGIRAEDVLASAQRSVSLPSPRVGHPDLIATLDRSLHGNALGLCGNWFSGLSIEDCALRAKSEWQRLSR